MASQPCTSAAAYRPHPLAKNERNRALIADYIKGEIPREALAARYGLSTGSMNKLLNRHGVRLPASERSRRNRRAFVPVSPGRRPVWPDCPPELADDYSRIRRKGFRAAEARALLDPEFAA